MISVIYGTRPEFIKLRPLVVALRDRELPVWLVRVAQHTDLCDGFEHDAYVEIPPPRPGASRLNSIFGLVPAIEAAIAGSDTCVVQGDTATAFAAALAAYNLELRVVHVEAGLRTYDLRNPHPEESYRQCISSLATLHMCPTEDDARNLARERRSGTVHVTGNTVTDNLVALVPELGDEVLITMHRRENLPLLDRWIDAFNRCAAALPQEFTFVCHPNPAVRTAATRLSGLRLSEPLPYDELLERLRKCAYVITDSGGLQEECAWLNKRVVVCRVATERPQTLCTTSFLCERPEDLLGVVEHALRASAELERCPFGDGQVAPRIAKLLEEARREPR